MDIMEVKTLLSNYRIPIHNINTYRLNIQCIEIIIQNATKCINSYDKNERKLLLIYFNDIIYYYKNLRKSFTNFFHCGTYWMQRYFYDFLDAKCNLDYPSTIY